MWWKTKARQEDDRLSTLESRCRALEASVKALDAEWTEMFDKFRRLHMRLAKRDQRAEDAPRQPNGEPPRVEGGAINPLAQRLLGGFE